MPDGVLEARVRAVVEERRLHGDVSERRCPELIAVGRIAGDLLEAEVLVFVWAVEDHVPGADPKRGAICGTPTTCISKSLNISLDRPDTAWQCTQSRRAKEQQRAFLLRQRHGRAVAARKPIDWCVGKDQRELEFRNRPAEHREIDRRAGLHLRNCSPNSARYAGEALSSP